MREGGTLIEERGCRKKMKPVGNKGQRGKRGEGERGVRSCLRRGAGERHMEGQGLEERAVQRETRRPRRRGGSWGKRAGGGLPRASETDGDTHRGRGGLEIEREGGREAGRKLGAGWHLAQIPSWPRPLPSLDSFIVPRPQALPSGMQTDGGAVCMLPGLPALLLDNVVHARRHRHMVLAAVEAVVGVRFRVLAEVTGHAKVLEGGALHEVHGVFVEAAGVLHIACGYPLHV